MIWLFVALFAGQFETAFRAGLVALNDNNLSVAQAQLEAASQLEPKDARVWLAVAQAYRKLHQLPAAQTAAGKAEVLATDPVLIHGLALYYSEAANYNKAAELFQAAIRKSPFQESYYFDLAQLHLKRQDF